MPTRSYEPFDVEALEPSSGAGYPPEPEKAGGPVARGRRPTRCPPRSRSRTRKKRDAEEPAEDVLEDTPDFLQETPENERLWFEQRPPRDFDWDK